MSEAISNQENEDFNLDDLIEAEARETKEQQEEEAKPDQSELERARAFAEKLNAVFLFGVSKAVCPSVENIDDIVNREEGNEALTPLALEMGGTVPPWLSEFLAKYDPYIKAGIYAGMTVFTAAKIEKHLQEEAEKAAKEARENGS